MSKICRFCLKTGNESYNTLESEEYKTRIKELIPETNINIVKHPVICSKCDDILVTAHAFKINCLRIEKQLKQCLKKGETEINLEDVLNKLDEVAHEQLTVVKSEIIEEETIEQDETLIQDKTSSATPIEAVYIDKTIIKPAQIKKDLENAPKIQCKVCKQLILGRNMREHIRTHIKSNYICIPCAKGFDTSQEYITHRQELHQSSLSCSICKKIFLTYGNLQKHLKYHEKFGDLKCKFCGLETDSKARLDEHVRVHTGERPFKCQFCVKSFAQSSTLSSHVKTMHSTERPFMCEVCGKSFPVRGAYGAHMKTHSEVVKNFVCKECGKAFRIPSMLREHEKRHAGVRDSICELCGKGFINNLSLKRHLRIHNGTQPYECPICGKKSNSNFNRKVHMKTCIVRNGSNKSS